MPIDFQCLSKVVRQETGRGDFFFPDDFDYQVGCDINLTGEVNAQASFFRGENDLLLLGERNFALQNFNFAFPAFASIAAEGRDGDASLFCGGNQIGS